MGCLRLMLTECPFGAVGFVLELGFAAFNGRHGREVMHSFADRPMMTVCVGPQR